MIVVELMGGLGNQLFQYALGKNLALKNRTELFIDTRFLMSRQVESRNVTYRNYDLDIFTVNPPRVSLAISLRYGISSSFVRRQAKRIVNRFGAIGPLTYVHERKPYQYDNRIAELGDNTYISGYWQSIRYLQPVEKQLRTELRFADLIPAPALALAEEIKNENSVCVHVRRSDFVANSRHNIVQPVYYQQAERLLEERVTTPVYYVFSDDIEWCRNNLQFSRPTVFIGKEWAGNRAQTHLQLMTLCRHYIIPNSTFGWWAAWLNPDPNKIVIAPKNWVYADGRFIRSDELIYPDWITI